MREPEKAQKTPFKVTLPKMEGANTMGFWKTTSTIIGIGALIGGSVFAMDVYRSERGIDKSQEQIKAEQDKAAQGLMIFNSDEERDLQRIRKFCFGFPWEKDAPTCRVWLRHYRQLGHYSDSDLFNEELTTNAAQVMNTPDAQPGNAESPAE
jgi:hypothetical protein